MSRDSAKHLLQGVGLAVAYVLTGKLGLMMDAVSGFATLVWPAAAIAFSALIRGGRRLWPAVTVGAFVVNLSAGAPPLAAAGIATGNTLEAVVGATAACALTDGALSLTRFRDAMALLASAVASPLLAATIGSTSLWLAGRSTAGFVQTWTAWWMGDAVGILVLAPLLLLPWRRVGKPRATRLESLLLAAVVLSSGWLVFGPPSVGPSQHDLRHAYFVFPVLIWAATRFGMRTIAGVTFAFSVLAICGTALGHGPFAEETLRGGLMQLQAFMMVAAATGLLLGASKADLARAQKNASALRAAAEEANREKDTFLAMLGHELRNPLSPIITAIELMKLRGQWSAKEQHVIERQVHHLVRLVDDLLDVSRITKGKIALKRAVVELSDIVANAVEITSPMLEQKRHALEVDVPRSGLLVDADPVRLAQVFANLLTNAARYTDPGGKVRVFATRSGDEVQVHVRDNGVGIEPEVLPRIFELFVQSKRCAEGGGLGLGLVLVRRLVELHGGAVAAHSDGPGKGSEFVVTLRIARLGQQPSAEEGAALEAVEELAPARQ